MSGDLMIVVGNDELVVFDDECGGDIFVDDSFGHGECVVEDA